MARTVSAASFLILLLLPLKSCLPLEWPQPPVARLLPISGLSWERRLSHAAWGSEPGIPPAPSEEGLFQDLGALRPCKSLEAKTARQQQRDARAASSSKRRDGRPNSLDLTFHLLREFLEMSREETLAQKARSNKILLQSIGK
uniref:Corticotropin-releasing factor domain-containing protein n=1 Tax=Varanus komodoensis TaxID=61221 RepID=A0A8D2J0H4_VARKO